MQPGITHPLSAVRNIMDTTSRNSLLSAFMALASEITNLPTDCFDWEPGDGEWTCRQIVAHVTHANDFYVTISEEAVRHSFGQVVLTPQLPGYVRMERTDAQVMSAGSIGDARALFEDRFERLLAVLDEFAEEDLLRTFTLSFDWWDESPHSTTLQERVINLSRRHMTEHREQLAKTVEKWRSTGLQA